jgi:glycosyltransferase involved in cell wall biosynthesis
MQNEDSNSPMKPISVIIPAYNEADRILNVLSVLEQIDYLEKIVVVDDGSRDATSPVVRKQQQEDTRIQLIQNDRNRGKGQSVFNAWEYCTTPYILMLDADLQGLKPDHIHQLCNPVLHHQADMTLGLFRGGQFATDFSHWAAPWLTGQRCMCSEILGNLSLEAARGYGIETAITVLARQMHYRVRRVYLMGMSHPPGEIHRGGIPGLINRIRMYIHIFRAWMVASGRKPEIRLQQPRQDSDS